MKSGHSSSNPIPAPIRSRASLRDFDCAPVLRPVDVEQGQSGDRMNLQARASHVDDTWCHDKVGVNRFQLPGQRPHAAGTEVLSVANSDHIGVQ